MTWKQRIESSALGWVCLSTEQLQGYWLFWQPLFYRKGEKEIWAQKANHGWWEQPEKSAEPALENKKAPAKPKGKAQATAQSKLSQTGNNASEMM